MSLELGLVKLRTAGATIQIGLQLLIYKGHCHVNALTSLKFSRLALKELLFLLPVAHEQKTKDSKGGFLVGKFSLKDYTLLLDPYLVPILIKMQFQSAEKMLKFRYHSMPSRLSALGIAKWFLLPRKSYGQNLFFFFYCTR